MRGDARRDEIQFEQILNLACRPNQKNQLVSHDNDPEEEFRASLYGIEMIFFILSEECGHC